MNADFYSRLFMKFSKLEKMNKTWCVISYKSRCERNLIFYKNQLRMDLNTVQSGGLKILEKIRYKMCSQL